MSYGPVVLLFEPIHEQALVRLRDRVEFRQASSLEEDALVEAVADVEGIIVRARGRVTRRLIEAAPRLKVIGRHGVGVETIDRQAAAERHIAVVNTPDANVESVAEHSVGMMLVLAKRMIEADRALRSGAWGARDYLTGHELHGKTLGIVGLGRIGRRVATICRRAFEMVVVYHDRIAYPKEEEDLDLRRTTLEQLLEVADVVSMHVPLESSTIGLIGEAALRRMKATAILINTSRGPAVDQTALVRALTEHWIAGAGLDVFDPEPLPTGHPLLLLENVVVSPHMSAHTEEALVRMADVAEDVVAVIEGQPAKHPVLWSELPDGHTA